MSKGESSSVKKLSRNVSLFWELFDYTETETKRIITTVPYPTSAKAFFDQIIPVEEMFYFNYALNTFYLRLYGVGHMVKDNSYSEREGKPAAATKMSHSFRLATKGPLYAQRG